MSGATINTAALLRTMFDAIPSLVFVVDEEVRIHEYNAAAGEFMSEERNAILKHRGGNVLHCIHAHNTPQGCGHSPFCKDCIIRNAVAAAAQGKKTVRRRAKIKILRDADQEEMYALISASPFRFQEQPFVLLIIEDISVITELQRMIPICSICKEIRDEKETWSRMETYFKNHWDVDFSHGLCPKCYESEMGKVRQVISTKPGTSTDH